MLTQWIIRKIPDYENVKDERVRSAYGKAASLVGIGCNVLLFAGKLFAGLLSGSVAIMADAVNNLSDASSSLISLLGFKLADKPADAEHPYGHGRFEYLSGMTVAVMILAIGVDLLKSSVGKIFAPDPVVFSWVSVGVLAASMLVKLWMAAFNANMGRRIGSTTLEATGQRQPQRRDHHRRSAAVHDCRQADRAGTGWLCRRGGGGVHPHQRRFAGQRDA